MVAGLLTPDLANPEQGAGGIGQSPWLPWLVGGLAVGCGLPPSLQPPLLPLFTGLVWLSAAPLLILAARRHCCPGGQRLLLCLLAMVSGMMAVGGERALPSPSFIEAEATVGRVLYVGHGTGFMAHIDHQHLAHQRPLFVRANQPLNLRSADRIFVRGRLSHEPGLHGGLRPVLIAVKVERILAREDGARGFAWQAIESLGPHRDLGAALLLGEGRPQARDAFHQAGLLHLLAVSGLHLGLALVMFAYLMRLIGLGWGTRQILLILAALGYAWLVGLSLPTQRAAIMTVAVVIYGLSWRNAHRLGPLSLAVLVLLLLDPNQAREVGFQLSALAVFGILTIGLDMVAWRRRVLPLRPWPLDRPSWRGLLYLGNGALDGLAVGLAATLAISPITAGNFGEVTPLSPVISVIAGPFLMLTLAAGLPLLFLQGLIPQGPWGGLVILVDLGLAGLVRVAEAAPDWLHGSLVRVSPPPLATWLLWYGMFMPLRGRWSLFLPLFPTLAVGIWLWAAFG